jgi:hypothetical protein
MVGQQHLQISGPEGFSSYRQGNDGCYGATLHRLHGIKECHKQ